MQSADPSRTLFNLENAQILIVDGDPMSMSIMSQILAGFEARHVTRCDAVEEAELKIRDQSFDLVILDPGTLGPGGYKFIHWLRRKSTAPNKFASVLIATGHCQSSRVSEARDSGANFVLAKPLTPTAVFDRIMWMARERRPYVECKVYSGPDRRFREGGLPLGEPGRREEDKIDESLLTSERELSQSDIDAIMTPTRRAQ